MTNPNTSAPSLVATHQYQHITVCQHVSDIQYDEPCLIRGLLGTAMNFLIYAVKRHSDTFSLTAVTGSNR